jgi:hypothetical protein
VYTGGSAGLLQHVKVLGREGRAVLAYDAEPPPVADLLHAYLGNLVPVERAAVAQELGDVLGEELISMT